MITNEEIIKLGFKFIGDISNRFFYEKNGFRIMEHNGEYRFHPDSDLIKTIEELNIEYEKYKSAKIKLNLSLISKLIKELKQLLTI